MTHRSETVDMSRAIGLSDLLAYLYCLMVSLTLVDSPLFGGALYLCGQLGTVFFSAFGGIAKGIFSKKFKIWRIVLLSVLLLSALALVLVYPKRLSNEQVWLVFAVVAALLLRDVICRASIRAKARGILPERASFVAIALGIALPMGSLLWILASYLEFSTVWPLMAGYVLCDGAALWMELLSRNDDQSHSTGNAVVENIVHLRETLRDAGAFRMYEVLVFLIVVALELTTVLSFSSVARLADNLLLALLLCSGVAFLAFVLSEYLLQRRQRKRQQLSDPTNVLFLGLVLWIFGLNSFRLMKEPEMMRVSMYVSLGMTTAGCSLCLSAVGWLEHSMRDVARFVAGREPEGFAQMRSALMDLAALVGQVLALGLMTLLIFTDSGRNETLQARVQPILMLPALILVFISLVYLLRFPLYSRTLGKLYRLENLKDSSQQNAIQSELKQVVAGKDRPFFGRIARWLIRKLYPHKLIGTENIHPDDDNPIVFLCNHGELYGPLVAEGYTPQPARLWVISNMAVNPDEVTEYLYQNTFCRQKWLPKRLRMPFSRLMGRFSVWGLSQLGGIPVWRDKPALLKRTFRATVDAMLAGDNILIFPENPQAENEEHYNLEGVNTFFSGFAMLGQLYWMRTGKRCRFLPVLAHKGTRTITYGEEIVYDPDRPVEEEIARISDTSHDWMVATWNANEKSLSQKETKV